MSTTSTPKYLYIDIRKSDDVFNKHFDQDKMTNFYNIPMNMIQFNKKNIIGHLNYINKIFIVCKSSKTSSFIKDKYFKDNENIIFDKNVQFNNFTNGENIINSTEDHKIYISEMKSLLPYSSMRILQLFAGTLLLISFILLRKCNNVKYTLLALSLMMIYNGLTGTCSISRILMNNLN
jgi:hypothetical protein